MEQPLVSVIVPVYNSEKRLSRCIESICAQTWQNLEIILLNDGSTDRSRAICEGFRLSDPRVRLVNKENTGVSDTRNLGLSLARGEYIQFVDSDDTLDPGFTQSMVAAAQENAADLVVSPYKMVIPRGMGLGQRLQEKLALPQKPEPEPDDPEAEPEVREYGFLPAGVYGQVDYALALMKKPGSFYYGALWNKLYRRDVIEQAQLRFSSELPWGEDAAFNLQYIRCAQRFCAIDRPGYYYVQNAQSICHTQINLVTIVQGKTLLFPYYKALYEALGIYEENRVEIYRYLVEMSENIFSAEPLKKAVAEVKELFRDILPEGFSEPTEAPEPSDPPAAGPGEEKPENES